MTHNDGSAGGGHSDKRRSLTSITLGWIAQRLRKAEKIRSDIESGHYQVDTEKVAAALLNEE